MEQLARYLGNTIPWLGMMDGALVLVLVQVFCASLVLFLFVAPFAGIISWVERRIAARMMDRVGPNRVGPLGFLQWLADGLKSLLKEDIIPQDADAALFRLAPFLVFLGMFLSFAAIPFGSHLIISDFNLGVYYLLAVSSFVVVGILMSGWASNNKFSLLGGMRAVAQIVSYEIPAALSVVVVVLLSGSLSMQKIIALQGSSPWEWNLYANPFMILSFVVMFVSSLAEGNRTPFDIPEAESELVSGYSTEYSGMRFVFFYFAEWANLYVIGALLTTLFLGGWNIPESWYLWAQEVHLFFPHLLEFAAFFSKSMTVVFVIIWLRWTLPRVRVDQMMILCWKYLIPVSFFSMMGVVLWMWIFPEELSWVRYVLFGGSLTVFLYFVYRVFYQLFYTRSEIDLNPFV